MTLILAVPLVLALYLPFCARVHDPVVGVTADVKGLWEPAADVAAQDLYHGPWGAANAPEPFAVYTHLEHKHTGVNPGMTVVDPAGREWSVKQAPPNGEAAEGPIEVVLSRVLSAMGYHQPPVYYLPSFVYRDDWGTRVVAGGRFRLKTNELKDRGTWSWQRSELAGTQPYQGLLVTLLLFNSSDLKNTNNTLYERRVGDLVEPWYVVRDLGMALGRTGRWAPRRGHAEAYANDPFITGVTGDLVQFNYRGWHQELLRERIRVADVRWAAALLSQLTERQWRDAFLAAGYMPASAEPFITAIRSRISQAERVGATGALEATR